MVTTRGTLTAPKHLRVATRRWWEETAHRWVLEPHHLRLLTLAAETWDRLQQARELIKKDGLTVATARGGPRLHPAVRIETDCRVGFARLIRELDLDLDQPAAETARPPALRSITR